MTIKEIASLAGVSISTVSKIVNQKDPNINQDTRNRVLNIVKEYHYTPYGTIKNNSTAKTFLLGVLLRDAAQSGKMLNGILKAANEHSYSILLFDSGCSQESELKHITSLCNHKVDGILWEPVSDESTLHERYFTEQDISVFYLNAFPPNHSFSIDYQKFGYFCTEKLLKFQHSNIACLVKENSFRSQQVLEGFKKCLFDHQISYSDNRRLANLDSTCISNIVSLKFTGILSSHFALALSLYRELDKLHYHIPSDLSLISLRTDSRETFCFPAISSLEIPFWQYGYESCTALISTCEQSEEDFSTFSICEACCLDHENSLEMPQTHRKKKIIVVGSINTDLTLMVDTLPQTGNAAFINHSSIWLGGKGANQAVSSVRLGQEAVLIGKTGNDAEANFVFDILDKEHVFTTGIQRDIETPTGKAYLYIEKDGEGTISILPGANACLSPNDLLLQEHLFEHSGFCLLSTEVSADTIVTAAKLAKKHSVTTILKPAALRELPYALYQTTDIFVPNKKEAAALCPQLDSVEEQANYFFAKGIPVVIITLGSQGCYLKTNTLAKQFPAISFLTVDTTGGADAFISALAVFLCEGYPLEKAIKIALYAAGFCVSRQGVIPALIDRNTLYSYISQMEPDLMKK